MAAEGSHSVLRGPESRAQTKAGAFDGSPIAGLLQGQASATGVVTSVSPSARRNLFAARSNAVVDFET